jgi:hypothetical protein
LGFDHEHTRHDRDENVYILYNNTAQTELSQFELNTNSIDLDAPYDFHSVMHYDSNFFQKNFFKPTIVSKIPVLISESNEIYHDRDRLTPIDVYKIQRLYKCPTIPVPKIVTEKTGSMNVNDDDDEQQRKIKERFYLEGKFSGTSDELLQRYLNKSYETCGVEHFWPPSYPLVESNHPLYKLMCLPKRKTLKICRFSFECAGEKSVCVQPFFINKGFCLQPDSEPLNKASQILNDSAFKLGNKAKEIFKDVFSKTS